MLKTNVAIDTLTRGLLDGGCQFTVNVPGSRSQEIFLGLGGETISMNERVAYELAYGASLSGKRSVVTMKNVGMNASADPFLHSVINGVQAGLVVILSDDVDALSSPERQDSRSYFDLFGGLWLEPNSVQMAYDFARNSFHDIGFFY
jgi:indolepyruvate ferredoxin oxidoreductase alpha subunit